MPTYEFDCNNNNCGHYMTKMLQLSFVRENINWNKPICPVCGSEMHQTFTEVPGLAFKEGDGIESSKPLSYWNNAERDRLNNQKKKKEIEKEKIAYRDKETQQKIDNLRKNIQQDI